MSDKLREVKIIAQVLSGYNYFDRRGPGHEDYMRIGRKIVAALADSAPAKGFTSEQKALEHIDAYSSSEPLVIDAVGLEAGKGTMVCHTKAEARAAVSALFGGQFGIAGKEVIVRPYDSVDAEPTEEMVEDGMQAMGYKAEGRSYGGARQRFIKGLRAALAVQQKGEG